MLEPEDPEEGSEPERERPRLIRLSRPTPAERRRIEEEMLRPGAEYVEASWRKTAPEGLSAIQRKVDQITGREGTDQASVTGAPADRRTSTPTKDLPPGLRSRIHNAFGSLAYVRLVYSTKEHHICRVGVREGPDVRDTTVLVGPDSVREVDSVLAAIDGMPSPDAAEPADERPEVPEPTGTPDRADPFGDIDPIEDVEGIGETYAGKLTAMGIETTPDLWHADTDEVAEALEVSPKVVARWQAQAELMAISGIGPQYAELLVRSGVRTIQALAEAEPGQLLEAIDAKQAELKVQIQGNRVTEKIAGNWIQAAQDHQA